MGVITSYGQIDGGYQMGSNELRANRWGLLQVTGKSMGVTTYSKFKGVSSDKTLKTGGKFVFV